MAEIMKNIAMVVLGSILAFVAGRLAEQIKQHKQKLDALRRLDRMMANVKSAVGHGHDFSNKGDWFAELQTLADVDRGWLDDLYEPIKRIAWRIRDQSFDHEKPEDYCCDELIIDLALTQLKILPMIPMKLKRRQVTARKLANQVLLCQNGILVGDSSELVEKFLKQWDEGKITIDKMFAMSSVVGMA
jgi:hypothetical protein